MTKNIMIILFTLFNVNLYSQQLLKIKGDIFYENYSYKESIDKYESVSEKTIELKRNLAHAYYNIQNYKKAETYFSQIIDDDNRTNEDVYNYASVLLMNKKYGEAEKWMKIYNKINITDRRGLEFVNNIGFYKNLLNDKEQFKVRNININSEQQDFGTSYFKNKIVFTSSRKKTMFVKRIWNWNKLPYLNLFSADNNNGELLNVKRIASGINKKYHDGPASFNGNGTYMAFTRNNYNNASRDGVVKLQIYFSEFKNNKWQKPKPFIFNSKEYSLGHPSLTKDGNTMFLASDMLGGFGGVDIYKCIKDENGNWSRPINLGSKINTEGDEMFPFIHEDDYLFFASNGLLGLGGLDVFMTKLSGNDYSKPLNLGTPINSSTDDFSFIIDKELKTGFFSSNRNEGKGSDDIYYFNMLKPFGVNIIGTAKNIAGDILANTNITLYNKGGKALKCTTDSLGRFSFQAQPEVDYQILAKKESFLDAEKKISTKGIVGELKVDLILKKIPEFSINCLVKDKKSNSVIDNVNVILQNKETNLIEEFLTDKDGTFNKKIKGKKLNDKIDYKIVLTKEGYMVKSAIVKKILIEAGEQDLIIYMDKMEVGMDLNDIIQINPIYFDLNKYNIRPDAAVELDKIVKVMNENPNMLIELGSHTDSRGSDRYNLRLSDRRAKSSAKYIKERISNPKNIYGKGYGETKLKNHCRNGVKCSEKEHQENRRTEFKIIKR